MASISYIQRIPEEIVDTIIANLAEDPEVLKNCALISTRFGTLCQSYLFRAIAGVGFYEAGNKALMRLIHTLTENRALLHHIREIRIGFSESEDEQCRLTSGEITRASSTLLQLSNLRSMEIVDVACTFGDPDKKLPQSVYTLLRQMVDTYLFRGTLRALHVLGLDDLIVPSLLTHTSLRELRLGRTPLPVFTFNLPHITTLNIYSIDCFDISILSHFPNLQSFSLVDAEGMCMTPPDLHCGDTSLLLRKLNLYLLMPHMTRALVEFYSSHTLSSGVRAFENLQELAYEVPWDDQLEGLQYILSQAYMLKVLYISTTRTDLEPGDPEFLPVTDAPLERLQLSTKILEIFPNLTILRISLHLPIYAWDYDAALSQAVSLLDSISHLNIIEEFAFTFSIDFGDAENFRFPPLSSLARPWSQIGRMLSNPAGFPMLRKVKTSLFVETDDDNHLTLMEFCTDQREELEEVMLQTKSALLARGIEFSSDGLLGDEW